MTELSNDTLKSFFSWIESRLCFFWRGDKRTEGREMAEWSEEKSQDLARGCDFLLPEPNPTIPPPLLSYASHIF